RPGARRPSCSVLRAASPPPRPRSPLGAPPPLPRERPPGAPDSAASVGASSSCAAAADCRVNGLWSGTMRRIVSLSLPSFATDRLTRLPTFAAWRAKPFATTAKAGGQLVIVAANAPAEAAGIAPGQVLADARALEPGLRVTAADPCAEGSALAALADGLTRYTPWVAV